METSHSSPAGHEIENVYCFRDHYVVEERAQGLMRFQVFSFKDGERHSIRFPEAGLCGVWG